MRKHLIPTLVYLLSTLSSSCVSTDTAMAQSLHAAIRRDVTDSSEMPAYREAIRALLKEGANPNLSVEGKNAMDVADGISWDWQQANARQELTRGGALATTRQAQHMLQFAVVYGNPQFVEQALACGAAPNAQVDANAPFPHSKQTTYLYATITGFECDYEGKPTNCVRLLLAAGANPNLPNAKDGLVPLLSPDCTLVQMELLLQHGANVNATDTAGRNVLIRQLEQEFPFHAHDMIRLLATAGLNLNHKDSQGKTALDYATANHTRHTQSPGWHAKDLDKEAATIALLRELGARPGNQQ